MASKLDASFFIPFHELDPSQQDKCIFFTKKGQRCRWSCQKQVNRRARELYNSIIAISTGSVSLELLKEYILCNCCGSEEARHRDRIVDIELLFPLAKRWQAEIKQSPIRQSTDVSITRHNSNIAQVDTLSTKLISDHAIKPDNPVARPFYGQSNTSKISAIDTAPTKQLANSHSSLQSLQVSSNIVESEPRYALRQKDTISTYSASTSSTSTAQTPLSEFRAHMEEPGPSDSISCKFLEPLKDRDFETGSLYIFDRDSSPGHVKIGWTARSVEGRLKAWSNCGYHPNLLFSVHEIPHAQRAETLTHYELIKEWRRERMCKASWCRKSHQEWFEIGKKRATQVVGDWAKFLKTAEPYEPSGLLKTSWENMVNAMKKREEAITAKKMLEYYEASLVRELSRVDKSIDSEKAPKIEDSGSDFGYSQLVGDGEVDKKVISHADSLRVERPALFQEKATFERKALTKQTLPAGISPAQEKKQFRSDRLIKEEPLSTDLLPLKTESSIHFKSQSKREPSSNPSILFNENQLLETNPLLTRDSSEEKKPGVKKEAINKKSSSNLSILFDVNQLLETSPLLMRESPEEKKPGVKKEAINKKPSSNPSIIFNANQLLGTGPLLMRESPKKKKPEVKREPINEELPWELIPRQPFIQPTNSSQEARRLAEIIGNAKYTISEPKTSNSIIDTSSSSQISKLTSLPAPASISTVANADVPYMSTYTVAESGIGRNSELLTFLLPRSESKTSNISATTPLLDRKQSRLLKP